MKMKRRSQSLSAGAIAVVLLSTGLVSGGATMSVAAVEPAATAVFSASPQLSGIDKVRPGDAGKDPALVATTVDGVECWEMKNDPYVRYLYVDVAQSAIPSGATRALVTVDYYDAGTAGFDIHYDAKSGPWVGSRNQALTDTHSWKSTTFELNNINFANRSNGHDFRLNVKAAEGSMPPVCFSKVAVTFTDKPVAALDSLAILNDSLIFKKGQASVEVATPAHEVTWRIGDENDVELRAGTTAVDGGEGSIDLGDLPFGYYRLDVTAALDEPITRTTSFAVLDNPPAGWNGDGAYFGTQLHRGWQPPEHTNALIDAMELAGYGLSRNETTWGEVEKEKGIYDFTSEGARVVNELAGRGLRVMWNAGLDNALYDGGRTPASDEAIAAFAAYVAATAGHYSSTGVSHDIGILNEYNSTGFNNGTCGMTAGCYLQILRPSYLAAHAADPKSNVIAPITAGVQLDWAQDFIAQGGLASLDTYATNYYGYAQNGPGTPPEASTELAELAQLAQLIDANAGDREIPLRITENGWPTHDAGSTQAQQANYAIRGPLLAQLAGADEYLWYDLYDDGFDGNERENRFGLINRADDTGCWNWICPTGNYEYGAVHGISPKPGFVTQAVAIRKTVGKELSEREALGSDSLYSLIYKGAAAKDTTRVLWSTGSDSVKVTSKKGFTLTNKFGASQKVAKGTVTLQLNGAPVFVEGAVTVASTAAAFALDVPETTVQGREVPVTLTIADKKHIRGNKVTVSADGVEQTIKVKQGRVSLSLPAVNLLGEREITVKITDKKGRLVSEIRDTTEVVDPYVVSTRPAISEAGSGYDYAMAVTIDNNAADVDVTVDSIDWKVGAASGTNGDALVVPGGGSKTVSIPVADPKLFETQSYAVTVHAGQAVRSVKGSLSFSPIEKDGATTLDPIDLNALGKWNAIRSGKRTGPADLGGSLRYTATADALVLHASITDDVHLADRTDPALSWQADSIQFNTYDTLPATLGGERVEIAAALTPQGPVVYTFAPPAGMSAGLTPGATADIVRDEAAGTTTYDVSVPWASLGYDGPPEGVWGLSFLVNDADGDVAGADARSGYIEWGSGVGGAPKNPALFKTVQIVGLD